MPLSYDRFDTYTLLTEHWDVNYFGDVVGYDQSFVVDTVRSDYRSFGGTVTPNYRTFRDANHYLPTNFANDVCMKVEGQEVTQTISYPVPATGQPAMRYRRKVKSILPVDSPPPAPANLVDEAWSKLRQKVLAQDFNAPVFLAEASKTVQMMVDRATRLLMAYRSLKHGRFGDVALHLGVNPRDIHNTWLEYKYGWKPLLNDIYGLANSLVKPRPQLGDIVTMSANKSAGGPYNQSGSTIVRGNCKYTAKAWVTIRIRNPSESSQNSFGLLNPLLIAWELLPFSFVGDWFINIGDCLQELTAFNGVDVLAGGASLSTRGSGLATEVNPSPWDVPRKAIFTYSKFDRSPGVQTLPKLMIKSDPLNLSKLITTGALIRQQR